MSKSKIRGIITAFFPIILIFLFNFGFNLLQSNSDSQEYYEVDSSFEISSMIVDIEANADRTAHIKETINANFLQPSASIFRDLPTNGGLEYRDIKVEGRAYSVEKYGNFIAVDLDAENFTQSLEPRKYIISYTLDYSNAVDKDSNNSIPLNVIGQGIPVKIHSAEINISLPEEPLESYYYVGRRNATGGEERLEIQASGKDINIETNTILEPYEGITVGYVMPNGVMHKAYDYSVIWKIAIGIVLIIAVYIIYYYKGKDEEITPVINFTAPKGMNPAEVGYLIDNSCSPEDMTSLIYYWASQEHLHIEEDDKGKLTLIRKSPLDDEHKSYEKIMYSALFKDGERVDIDSLKNKFYMTIESSSASLKNEYRGKLFGTNEFVLSIVLAVVASLVVGIWSLLSGLLVSAMYFLTSGFVAAGIASAIIFIIGTTLFRYEPKVIASRKKFYLLFYAFVALGGVVISMYMRSQFVSFYDSVIMSIIYSLMMLVIPFTQKRTPYYHSVINELTGFKVFLVEAEKDRLEMLLKDNPQYYYDILPYANVLGVSDEWMNKFKNLTIERPIWYYSPRPFSIIIFNRSFRRTYNTMSRTMVSRPSNQGRSGGGFGGGGGGGFSGGGFGGGGMRSR